ncbi:M10 family metallopeptidase [Oryzifoliimicrobium ureilyticus]|uniref:M10 family metallopeptidase n=1 Tax=Oryzifoliimicrobium ureilyticus TaxID=3113724 RepID=UPI0030765E68
MAATLYFSYDQIASQLTNDYWISAGQTPHHFSTGDITVNVSALTASGQQLAQLALKAWSDVANIHFTYTSAPALINFDDNQAGAFTAYSYYSGTTRTSSASVNIGLDWLQNYGTSKASYSFQTYIHEIGHALGLGHAGNYNGDAVFGRDNHYINDSWQASVMSYFSQSENLTTHATAAYDVTPMVADIIAIQQLYGAANAHIGDDVYAFEDALGIPTAQTLLDPAGYDTLDLSSVTHNQFINLNPETYSNIGGLIGNIGIGRGTYIEKVIGGSGSDVIVGNRFDNVIEARSGNDGIDGGPGNDVAIFGVKSADAATYKFMEGCVVSSQLGNDQLFNIETLRFSDKDVQADLHGSRSIYEYGASYKDLAIAFGSDASALMSHFANFGLSEGRGVTFDARLYLGAYNDLRAAFSKDIASAAKHFIDYGINEGRSSQQFNFAEYIASYKDLISAFGVDQQAATNHYFACGFEEGRGDNFDALQYIASYGDLIKTFSSDRTAGAIHYIEYGQIEGRHATFNSHNYVHARGNEDLLAAFGENAHLAENHYIMCGFYEGRILA